MSMVRPGGYRTQAQKDGRSAGQRKRRMARNRKQKNREQGVYPISVRSSVADDSPRDDAAVYGIYSDNGEWILTAMAVERTKEKMVSDRQGAVQSETVDRLVVVPSHTGLKPRDGVRLGSFDKKSDAMRSIDANSSTRLDTGVYIVKPDDWSRNMKTHKVDRNRFGDFRRKHKVRSVR